MKRRCCLLFLVLLLFSCNSYQFADHYTAHALKKNGLHHRSTELEKYSMSYWDSETDKPALILLHGFATSGKFQWYKQAAALSKNYRLIIVDLLYFGSTPKTPSYSVDDQAQAIKALLEKLQINTFYLCGSSYGGLIASELTLHYPEKVRKLILMDAPVKYLTEADINSTCQKYNIRDEIELFVPSDPVNFKRLMRISYLKEPKITMSMVRTFYKYTYATEMDNLKNIYHSLKKENKTFAATDYHFTIPVLLIWGKEDELVPLHVGQDLKTHIGNNARLEIVPDAAHLPNLENKAAVNMIITGFLKE